jgi:pyruvate formate lyase activating enzyme
MIECRYYEKQQDGRLKCLLCPHGCVMGEGQHGRCGSRRNDGGILVSDVYGKPCALADDPIEKKPLNEFHPGTRCLSLACTGCNFRCLNCQNHDISQALPSEVDYYRLTPQQIIDIAEQHHIPGIAYTYTEPLTYIEYISDIATLAHEHHLWNILVSAGYINPGPMRDLAPLIDAANIDLKSFSDDIYRRISGGHLQPVLDTLLILHEAGTHLEITNLLIPEVNDDMEMIRQMCRWLVEHDMQDCPLHFSRFFPRYKMSNSYPTPKASMIKARDIAIEEGIKRVYLGNV